MLFSYKAYDAGGRVRQGQIEAVTKEVAISALQRRSLVIAEIDSLEKKSFLAGTITFFDRVSTRDIVIFSRQISTLFEARIPTLEIFQLLASESHKPILRHTFSDIVQDIQAGGSIAKALSKHPKLFSRFYVNMVAAGEESGQLSDVFVFLADYLERSHEIISKARGALVYPAFVITTFLGVIILLLTAVIPRLTDIITDAGQEVPIYTKIIIWLSNVATSYGLFLLIIFIIAGFFVWRYTKTKEGRLALDSLKIKIPYVGGLYKALYLSRISDNLDTMLAAGIPMVRALEVTASIIDNKIYEDIFQETVVEVRGGSSVSKALSAYDEIPSIMTHMIKVGEEAGEMGQVLKTLANFYRKEVYNAVTVLVSLIEPALIILLGGAVAIVVASVLVPIYNLSSAI